MTQPLISGDNKKSKEWPPSIIRMGLPPAGGCVEFNKIIKKMPSPTDIGITAVTLIEK